MDKATIKAFIAWLDRASDAEIAARRELIQAREHLVSTREGRADLNLALRLMDEELLARLDLANLNSPRTNSHDA